MSPLIVTIYSKGKTATREVKKESFTVGRAVDCDLHLNDNSISRVHLVVSLIGNKIFIEDKKSSNGTFVNGNEIAKNVGVQVKTTDKIQVGTSEFFISISAANVVAEEAAQAVKVEPVEDQPIAKAAAIPPAKIPDEPVIQPVREEVPQPVSSSQKSGQLAEKAVQDAKMRAAQILIEAEAQAERKVQGIYEKARKVQEQAEELYEKRIADANKAADGILGDFQKQGQELLREARAMSETLREDVEGYIQSLRKKSKIESDEMIAEATAEAARIKNEAIQSADKMKAEAIEAGHVKAKKDLESLITVSQEEAAKIIEKAQKQAAEMLEKAERQASDNIVSSQQQLEENRKQATELSENSQRQAKEVVETAQRKAEELLLSSEQKAKDLVNSAQRQATDLNESSKKQATELLESHQRQATDSLQTALRQAEEISLNSKKQAAEIVAKAQQEAEEFINNTHKQLTDTQEKLRVDSEALEKLNRELTEVQIKVGSHRSDLAEITQKEAELSEKIRMETQSISELETSRQALLVTKQSLEDMVTGLQDKQLKLSQVTRELESKQAQLQKEAETQKILLSEKLEKEKVQMMKIQEQRSEEMRIEFSKKMQKMEEDLVADVMRRQDSLVKEILSVVENQVVQLVDAAKWRLVAPAVEARIKEAFEGSVASMSQSTASSQKPVDLIKKRKNENLRFATIGLLMGLAAFFVTEKVYRKVQRDQNPMQTRVDNETKQRQKELEKRRFNPPQSDELKSSYVDAVIYTRGFVEKFTAEDFQQRLYKEASQYMLKTWRLDEDKTLQVLSAANALVKELAEKKAKIHPDFVKDGLDKMKQLETETLERMKTILGSEVRLESFRRFEHNFYNDDVQKPQEGAAQGFDSTGNGE